MKQRAKFGDYKLIQEVGRGGFAVVYKALDSNENLVALKILKDTRIKDEKRLERFRREARVLKAVSHPNIVKVLTYGEEGNQLYIVMEYLDGETLDDILIRQEAPFAPEASIQILEKVAYALDYMHKNDWIHRDVNPRNIFVTKNKEVKLLDMGIAREIGIAPTPSTRAIGTLPYMAPEQSRSSRNTFDHRVDIYCLGAVAFRMLTNEDYKQSDLLSKFNHSLGVLEPVLQKVLAEEPKERYSSARDFVNDLRSFWDAPIRAVQIKAFCIGSDFPWELPRNTPGMQLIHSDQKKIIESINYDEDVDLILIDSDNVSDTLSLIERIKDKRDIPIITLSKSLDRNALTYMQQGSNWHITKDELEERSDELEKIIREYIFGGRDWKALYQRTEKANPQLDPGLDYDLLSTTSEEERYILKRLFPHSKTLHIFRVETGLSRSRIYRISSDEEPTRIVKIETLDNIAKVVEKFERLIRPRLDRYIGQIENRLVKGEHLGGASYLLAGSRRERDVSTLTEFLLDRGEVREDAIDDAISRLQRLLSQLYVGSVESQIRYWAPYYSRVLPPLFVVTDGEFLTQGTGEATFTLNCDDFQSFVAAYDNPQMRRMKERLQNNEIVSVILKNFEISEIDPIEGIMYVQDDIVYKQTPPTPRFIPAKDHPLMRFKIILAANQRRLLSDSLVRKGKRVTIKGYVKPDAVQEAFLREKIQNVIPELYGSQLQRHVKENRYVVNLVNARFIDPIQCVNLLLWEVGREDFIKPLALISPVVHGDLNTNNVLVESNGETQVWLIDFNESRFGHIYFDLAKLEIEFRTHILYKIFAEMTNKKLWSDESAIQVAMLIENLLFDSTIPPAEFAERLATPPYSEPQLEQDNDWYDQVFQQYHLYWKKLLYFLAKLRSIAVAVGRPEQYAAHYPVALFFQSISVLKYNNLDNPEFFPWAKRLALISALVSGTRAVKASSSINTALRRIVERLKEPSALAIIRSGKGNQEKFLLQFVPSWSSLNLIGGKMKIPEDNMDFSITLQRELKEELHFTVRDYQIMKEYPKVEFSQFSKRDRVHKDYEFHIFEVRLSKSTEKLVNLGISGDDPKQENSRWNYWASANEIGNHITSSGIPISDTTHAVLTKLGIIKG